MAKQLLYLHVSPHCSSERCAALTYVTVVNMSEKNSLESHSLERADTLNGREGDYDDKDVFGHEEEHDVRDPILLINAHPQGLQSWIDLALSESEDVG